LTISDLCKEIKKLNSVLIISHSRPDGDTIGSAMGLKLTLETLNIKADIVCENNIPEKFNFLIPENSFSTEIDINKKYDGIIAVDCSDENRFGNLSDYFKKAKTTFNIDHHISNTRYAKFNYVEERAATTEIILEIALCFVESDKIEKSVANCLLLGICTDTGNFAHQNVTEKTLIAASKLVACGGELHNISYYMFKNQKKQRAELFAKTISKIRYFNDSKISIISVFMEEIEKANASSDMTEGFIDFPLSIEGVEVAVCLLQSKKNQYKISFRSKGTVDVNEIAGVFGGGGHILASGCMINGEYEEVIDKLVYAISARL
jgi:phosphoesterase RecJ-like protein